MKNTILIFSVLMLVFASQCRNEKGTANKTGSVSDTGKAVLVFNEYEHQFGKVAEGEKISWQFTYENKGTADLVLNSVTTTCGCTVPKFETKPVPPGGNGNLEVVFDTSGRNGMQTKTITVKSNAKMPVVLLKITAEVEAEQ
jgi:hypothetical protein